MDGRKINQKKRKGFTLIELLATIAILAIVSVIVIFTATSVIGKARAKSYLASVTNIEKNSSSYAIENNSDIRWISTDDNNGEYYCVTVKDLMDIGFLDKDVLESEIDKDVYVEEDDYIYLERDVNTKTVTKSILIAGKNNDLDYCDDYKTDGIISFSTVTGWSNNKDVVIDYYILNFKGNVDDYEYYYKREDTGEEVRNKFNNASSMSIKVEEFKAEEIIARIYYQNMKIVERTFKTKIDKVKPEIELLVNNGNSYKKGNDVYINLLDKDSGFKRGKHKVYYKWSLNELTCDEIISNGDYVELSVDANNLNKSNIENLYLTNNSGTGKIYACSDSVYDYVGNKLEGVYSADVYLDNDKPIVSLGNYTKDDKVYVSTTIELLVNDKTSGVKDGSFTKEDLVVYVGDKILDTSNITLTKKDDEGRYELVINNKTEAGKVTIIVKENSVEDKAGNKNDEFTFKPEIMFAVDTTPPICTLSVTDESGNVKITASSSDNDSGISYNGWNSSYSGDSSNTNTINKTGKYTYYVKDNAGNKGSCSVDISNTYVSMYNKVTKVCNQKLKDYTKTVKTCSQSVSYTCSRAAIPHYSSCTIFKNPGDCRSHSGCSWNNSSCSGSYVSVWSCGNAVPTSTPGGCLLYNQEVCTNGWGVYQTHYSYVFEETSNSTVDSCSNNDISCNASTLGGTYVNCVKNYTYELGSNTTIVSSCSVTSSISCSSASNVGKSYVSSCIPSEYKCSSGVKINNKYCYKTS